ncbi:MAG: ABC transporter ATP-binding protein, partial [Pseudomonadota bacterium]
ELTKSFQGNKVLDQVSWSVEKNRTIGLLGPNGAGKSTTMKIITGLLSPSGGGVWIDEQNVHQNPVEAKAKIGFLPETPPLYQELSVHRFFKFICGLKGIKSIEQQNEIDRVVEKLGLESVLHKSLVSFQKVFDSV